MNNFADIVAMLESDRFTVDVTIQQEDAVKYCGRNGLAIRVYDWSGDAVLTAMDDAGLSITFFWRAWQTARRDDYLTEKVVTCFPHFKIGISWVTELSKINTLTAMLETADRWKADVRDYLHTDDWNE